MPLSMEFEVLVQVYNTQKLFYSWEIVYFSVMWKSFNKIFAFKKILH